MTEKKNTLNTLLPQVNLHYQFLASALWIKKKVIYFVAMGGTLLYILFLMRKHLILLKFHNKGT